MSDNELLDGFLEGMGFSERVKEVQKKREEKEQGKSNHPLDQLDEEDYEQMEAETAKELLESAYNIVRDGDLRRRIKKFLKESKSI